VPSAALQGGALENVANVLMGLSIPVHMHIGLAACITDYLPRKAQGEEQLCFEAQEHSMCG
jgi:hypothetical protein